MRKIVVINYGKPIFIAPYNIHTQIFLRNMYGLFAKCCQIAILEDNEIKVILTYDEFLNSEV